MNFVNSSILTGFSTIVKIASNLIVTKIVAYFYGPSGMYVLGNLTNLLSFIKLVSTGGVEQGVVKYLSEHAHDRHTQKKYIIHAIQIASFFSCLIGVILVLFRSKLNSWIFIKEDYHFLFIVIGLTSILFSLNLIFLNILNGLRELKRFIVINIIGNLFALCVTLMLFYLYDLQGILLGFCIQQSIVIIPTIILVRNDWWLRISFVQSMDKKVVKNLFKFSSMAIVSALTIPLSLFLIRHHISDVLSEDHAGMWEALVRISSVFIIVIGASFSTYLLPTFSALKGIELRYELLKTYKIVIPACIAIATVLFLVRILIIKLLYSDAFLQIEHLFIYQVIGDTVKAISLVTGYLIVSRGMAKAYIINELLFLISYTGLSYFLVQHYGIKGATLSYIVATSLCLLFHIILFRKTLWGNP